MATETKIQPSTAPPVRHPHAPAPSGRSRWILVAAVILAVAGGVAWYKRDEGKKTAGEEGGNSRGAGPEAAVSVQTVRLTSGGIVRTSTQIGTVQPFKEADLYAKVSGYLHVLNVDYGDRVKAGKVLAEIDDPEIVKEAEKAAADVAQAKAAVAQAEAFVESAKADRDASASAVEQAVAEVSRYTASRVYHVKKLSRYKELVQSKAIPQQIADEEEDSYEAAKSSEVASQKGVLNARAQLLAATARVKKAEADVAEAKATVQVNEAKLGKANVLVGYTSITSPYDGVITRRTFFPGAFIRSASDGGLEPLLTVARIDKVRVVTQIPDRDVPFTDVGDDAEITLDALPGEVFKGKVSRFADAEDPTTRTMHTEIDLTNPKDRIKPGMYGIARVILDSETKKSTLPAKCLCGESRGGKAEVYSIHDGKAKKTSVTVGADDGIRVEIVSGLDPKDDVILNTGSVTDGMPVVAAGPEKSGSPDAADAPQKSPAAPPHAH